MYKKKYYPLDNQRCQQILKVSATYFVDGMLAKKCLTESASRT